MRGDQNQRIKDNEDLAFQLSQIYGADQVIRQVPGNSDRIIVMQKIDSLNFVRIIDFKKNMVIQMKNF